MSYINQYGQAIGPIKINNVWLTDVVIPALSDANRKEQKYFGFTHNINNITRQTVPLMAATPPLGTYQSIDENNNVYNNLCAPRNAVATVEWVMAYASLAPGELVGIDINQYATVNQIKELQTQIDTMDSRVVDQAEKINTNTQNIAINTANIADLTKRMNTAELNIANNTRTINDMLDNPFPEGFWLICGEQLT